MTTEIVNSYHQTAVPVCIRLCCRSAEAKKEEKKKKRAQFADTFLERSAPRSYCFSRTRAREKQKLKQHITEGWAQ